MTVFLEYIQLQNYIIAHIRLMFPPLKIFALKKKKILESFNDTCNESCVYLTPTVHGLLEHGSELIDANNGEGLGAFTDSTSECNNEMLRLNRISQSHVI